MNAPKDYEDDEVIDVKLPRSEFERLRAILERERTYNYIHNWIKSNWIIVVAGSALTVIMLYEKVAGLVKQGI